MEIVAQRPSYVRRESSHFPRMPWVPRHGMRARGLHGGRDGFTSMTPRRTPSAVSATLVSAFHQDGFAVMERVTTLEDLARIKEIMVRLYRQFPDLARARYAWNLGVAGPDESPE